MRPDGFYEIKVGYAECLDLAWITGVKPTDVLATVDEDNSQRRGAADAGPSRQGR